MSCFAMSLAVDYTVQSDSTVKLWQKSLPETIRLPATEQYFVNLIFFSMHHFNVNQ